MSTSTTGTANPVLARIAAPFRAVHWYLKEVMGENAYLHYLESFERRHGTRKRTSWTRSGGRRQGGRRGRD